MLIKKMSKIITLFFFFIFLLPGKSYANDLAFDLWLGEFKKKAIQSGISINVVNDVMSNARFLPKVIEYDRYQPEFYEDTFTYIKKENIQKKNKKRKTYIKKKKK